MRQIVLDTETTGLEPSQGHRIIEIGCVEINNRKLSGRHYHQYIRPDRDIDEGAYEVHGISNEFLADKPVFEQIVGDFLDFVGDAELIIHNAPFDVGFINHELSLLAKNYGTIEERCRILDSLALARRKHPGQKNSLDALCKRYQVDNSQRELHGALLDAEILADVYLIMTGGQTNLALSGQTTDIESNAGPEKIIRVTSNRQHLPVVKATDAEMQRHQIKLQAIDKSSSGQCIWLAAD